jgi:hypothetical protein
VRIMRRKVRLRRRGFVGPVLATAGGSIGQRPGAWHPRAPRCPSPPRASQRELVYSEACRSVTQALKREHQLKRWTRTKKEALIAGDVAKLKGTKPSEAKRLTAEA